MAICLPMKIKPWVMSDVTSLPSISSWIAHWNVSEKTLQFCFWSNPPPSSFQISTSENMNVRLKFLKIFWISQLAKDNFFFSSFAKLTQMFMFLLHSPVQRTVQESFNQLSSLQNRKAKFPSHLPFPSTSLFPSSYTLWVQAMGKYGPQTLVSTCTGMIKLSSHPRSLDLSCAVAVSPYHLFSILWIWRSEQCYHNFC